MEKNIVVPDFVVDAILAAPLVVASRDGRAISLTEPSAREVARRVCVALSENPTAPNDKQTYKIREAFFNQNTVTELIEFTVLEWQRRMFLAPEPEIPKELEGTLIPVQPTREQLLSLLLEVFHRGQKAGPK